MTKAGTMMSSGNSQGMKWVTSRCTGPSFGSAGNSGKTHKKASPNAV